MTCNFNVCSRRASGLLRAEARGNHGRIPAFLCPVLLRPSAAVLRCSHQRPSSSHTLSSPPHSPAPQLISRTFLPLSCPGCGALTQSVNADEAGYYTITRHSVRRYGAGKRERDSKRHMGSDEGSRKERGEFLKRVNSYNRFLVRDLELNEGQPNGGNRTQFPCLLAIANYS